MLGALQVQVCLVSSLAFSISMHKIEYTVQCKSCSDLFLLNSQIVSHLSLSAYRAIAGKHLPERELHTPKDEGTSQRCLEVCCRVRRKPNATLEDGGKPIIGPCLFAFALCGKDLLR